MADTIQFYVDDTSPTISYSPFGDTFSLPDLTAGWNPYFDGSNFASTLGEIGNGTSYHVTSRDGASLSVQWQGTGIQLFGKVNQATYSITIDGTPIQAINADLPNNVLAYFNNLTDTIHTIVLTTHMPAVQNQSEFFFDKALIFASYGQLANVTQQALNDGDIAYSGQWSFRDPSGSSFHHSETPGDRAEATFRGIAFLLNGTTSPSSGRYTIILDNIATTLSAKSSFLQRESLLFYANSLDPNVTHTLQVVNEDGSDLSLNVGGFGIFSSGSAISETPSPTPSPSTSLGTSAAHRKGTIAALVLGGVLFFLIFTSALFFVLVVRPRRQRRKLFGLEQNRKQAEAGIVIDIGPESESNIEFRGAEIVPPQRTSERSSFARWKREMEGGLGSLIGISFRHSDSSRGKNASRRAVDNNHLRSPKSSLFSSSSKSSGRSKGKGKKKFKRQHLYEGSWSPGVAIELPARPSSADSSKGKYIEPSQDIPAGPHSVISTLTSLSYVSSPSAYLTRPLPPPSYSDSNSNGNSHSTSGPHSVPHSVSHSLTSATYHNGRENQGFSQTYSDHKLNTRDLEPSRDRSSQTPDMLNLSSRVPGEDRNSARNSSDDAGSILAAAFTQFALRGLSPRTSEFIQAKSAEPKKFVEEQNVVPRVNLRPLPEPPESQADQSDNRGARDNSRDIPPEPAEERVRETRHRSFGDSFLNVLASSPFRVDFPPVRPPRHNRDSGPPVSFVRFDEELKDEPIPGGEQESSKQGGSQDPKAKRRSLFRLTPLSGLSRSRSSRRPRADSMSFLDFSSSSDSSTRTHSLMTSEEQEGGRQWGNILLHHRLQARWSNTATELSRNASIGAPRSVFSGNFPYPVSLPTSPHHPEGHIRPEGMTISTQRSQHIHDRSDSPPTGFGIHPLSPLSPVDSVPVSVSEIQFRRNSATSNSTDSPIPPHPPLPGRDIGSEIVDSVTPPLSTPNLIVQRVLGQTPASTPSTQHYFSVHQAT